MLLGKKIIALTGAESTGKSTLAHMLVGRLRTHGVRAALAAEPGSALPFDPKLFDTEPQAHTYAAMKSWTTLFEVACRPNTDVIIADRTPLDFVAYQAVKHSEHFNTPVHLRLRAMAHEMLRSYDRIYFMPTEATPYDADGYRAALAENSWRAGVSDHLRSELNGIALTPGGINLRERSEWVWQHVLAELLGKHKVRRVYQQVEQWFRERGWRVLAVRPQGSNSLVRFHPASDNDDFDVTLIVDGDANYAIEVRADFIAHKEQLENIIQGDLDILVTPKGMASHEV